MARLLKLIGVVIGALVVLFIAVAIGIALFVDPNDYKGQITAAVARSTGRELTLGGDLELDVFPTLRISLSDASLSNAPGFGEEPFARINSAALQLKVLPLLMKRIEVGEARLDGLVLNLARDAQGRNNWQDLGGAGGGAEPAEPAPEEGAGGGANVNLDVGVIDIANSEVTWTDAASDSRWTLGDFNLHASDFGTQDAFPLTMDFALAGEDLNVTVGVDTRATLSLADNAYRLEDLKVILAGSGAQWPGGEGQATLQFASFAANLNDETLDLDGLTLQFLGITANGSLEGRQLLSDLALTGKIDIDTFNPADVLQTLGASIETADPSVLQSASAAATLLYDANQIGLRDMQFVLDDSQLTGSVGMEGESLRFDLNVDQINIDRYLPPAEEGAAASQEEGSLDAVDLPLDVLRTLDASGKLAFGQAQFAGLTLTDAAFALTARDGHLQLTPSAQLYGGSYSGDIAVDVQGEAAQMTLGQQLTKVDMAPLGMDLLDSAMVSGTGNVELNLTAAGSNLGQMRRELDGDVSFTVTDGALEGFDLWFELRRALAVANSESPPTRPEGPRRTPFSSLSASGVVQDALLTNRDLNATLPFVRLDGTGTVNLLTDALDFDLMTTFVDGEMLQSDPAMAKLAGDQLPLQVGGTIAEPSIRPDVAAMVKARAQEEVEERVEEKKEDVREQLRDRLRGLLDR